MNKWLKRAVCTAVIAAVTLLCLPCFAQSNTHDESFTDKLYAFGITDGDFSGENYITRGDLVKYAVRMNGMDISQFQQPSPFIDVAADTENAAYINAAYNLGLVNGVSDTQFMPGDFVTLEQAAKIMICIAGYGEIAKYKGGLPDGYMNTAADLGLFKGVEADKDGYLTPTACARLMMNVLLCDAGPLQEWAHGRNTALKAA